MKTQQGFGLVPILLILLLVTAVGFTGYYVYDKQSSKNLDSSAAVAGDTSSKLSPNPTVTPTAKATATPTVAATPSPSTQKYLVIKEWGVKIPLTDDINDLKYSEKNGTLALGTAKFAEYSNDVCPNNDGLYLGGIKRSIKINDLYDTPARQAENKAIKLGEYYYLYYNPGQMYCQHDPVNQVQIDYFMKIQPIIESATNRIVSI